KDDLDNITGGVHLIHTNSNIKKFTNQNSSATFQFEDIIGENAQIKKTIELGKIAARSISHVLLQGESGTGKEVLAQAIHNESFRWNKPFVAVNCGAIPRELIGSELFGFEGGSFTGAKQGGKPGKFELASGGTLFLDEIGEMPLEQQVALLRVLQDQQITRIGGEKNIKVDVRIICATNKNLRLEASKGNFREDLFYRLNVISICLPPLRERKEDIPLLFDLFIKRICKKLEVSCPSIDPKVMSYFMQYDWPGNVRELQNVIERILNLANGMSISIEHLPDEMLYSHPAELRLEDFPNTERDTNVMEKHKIKELLDMHEQKEIMDMLINAKGNLSQVARDMGISRNTLYKKLKKLNISTK
ncbi:MAG TPA: sigma 54-interacting transcriptional regulator, partial [Bacillales bacterium]|nr:sigma 54-interacting transcriptional regulator [Bacillales bacterium]